MCVAFHHLNSNIQTDLLAGLERRVSNVCFGTKVKAISPGSVPSTRPGVGLSAPLERRRSTGARVAFSHATDSFWASPSITASYGMNTHLASNRQQWDQSSWKKEARKVNFSLAKKLNFYSCHTP